MEPKENKMGTMPIHKLLISMALPMVISMLVQAFYNVVDSMFVSRLSENALTAVSLAFPVQTLMIAVAIRNRRWYQCHCCPGSLGEKKFRSARIGPAATVFCWRSLSCRSYSR